MILSTSNSPELPTNYMTVSSFRSFQDMVQEGQGSRTVTPGNDSPCQRHNHGSPCPSMGAGNPTSRPKTADSLRGSQYLTSKLWNSANGSMSDMTLGESDDTQTKRKNDRQRLSVLYSWIYAMALLSLGVVIYLYNQSERRIVSEIFSIAMAVTGICWLVLFHLDLHRYKQRIMETVKESLQDTDSNLSTEFCFNIVDENDKEPASYRFLQGRHSGSMFLKFGMAAFCFGHLINELLVVIQHSTYYYRGTVECFSSTTLCLHVIWPLYSFYLLFIVFKYSNRRTLTVELCGQVVIHKFKALARFGVIHIIVSCLCFWFATIMEDALEDYNLKNAQQLVRQGLNSTEANSTHILNRCPSLLTDAVKAFPSLYPFTIEFYILQAGVWIIIYQNIGRQTPSATSRHFRQRTSCGNNVVYQSNLVISADCHSANKGFFAGLLAMAISIITIIIFFINVASTQQIYISVLIHSAQEAFLSGLSFIGIFICYFKIFSLDRSVHPIHFLDDLLVLIPLPFYYINIFMSIYAEFQMGNWFRVLVNIIVCLQVSMQTPFIIDGLRRCSNSQKTHLRKPGREILTFLIITNIALWIINSTELRSVEEHYAPFDFYGSKVWMFVGHTTLPLMLFYRFHSAVCLADIWKSAYEKEKP
ncbi:Otopetrin [Cordylochernes scorpioides]|uniref:Otopetrin n=1 Tax=Cordylochernes scorpioides TaxID=51811 RepID=A0ABY6K733_9ARAC|nr:Otopetrin [Cordylochernes scorpioides]